MESLRFPGYGHGSSSGPAYRAPSSIQCSIPRRRESSPTTADGLCTKARSARLEGDSVQYRLGGLLSLPYTLTVKEEMNLPLPCLRNNRSLRIRGIGEK